MAASRPTAESCLASFSSHQWRAWEFQSLYSRNSHYSLPTEHTNQPLSHLANYDLKFLVAGNFPFCKNLNAIIYPFFSADDYFISTDLNLNTKRMNSVSKCLLCLSSQRTYVKKKYSYMAKILVDEATGFCSVGKNMTWMELKHHFWWRLPSMDECLYHSHIHFKVKLQH